jgi:hypothetical protein
MNRLRPTPSLWSGIGGRFDGNCKGSPGISLVLFSHGRAESYLRARTFRAGTVNGQAIGPIGSHGLVREVELTARAAFFALLGAGPWTTTDPPWRKERSRENARAVGARRSGSRATAAGSTLIATWRSSFVSLPRYTSPIPPAPSSPCLKTLSYRNVWV